MGEDDSPLRRRRSELACHSHGTHRVRTHIQDLPSDPFGTWGPTSGTPSAKHAELIDDLLAAGLKSGYVYRYKPIDTWRSGRFDAFTVIADPLATEGTKQRHYFVDQTGVIRVETDRPATTGSPPSDSVPY